MAIWTVTILLGMMGVLDGKRATTNKLDFTSTVHLAPKVEWVKQALGSRWQILHILRRLCGHGYGTCCGGGFIRPGASPGDGGRL